MQCLFILLGTIASVDNFWPQTTHRAEASVHLQSSEIHILYNRHSKPEKICFFSNWSIQILIVVYFPKTHFCHYQIFSWETYPWTQRRASVGP